MFFAQKDSINASFIIFVLAKQAGPIVQWIECKIPVLMIWVRIPVGSLQKTRIPCKTNTCKGFFFVLGQLWGQLSFFRYLSLYFSSLAASLFLTSEAEERSNFKPVHKSIHPLPS